jgi:hypothetical protein
MSDFIIKRLLVVGFVFILSTGCNTESVVKSSLSGVWIEATHKIDTLAFNNQFQGFSLNRGREVRVGYSLPKEHSGSYTYELKADSISLLWSASDYNKGTNYYFKTDLKNNQLKIENFYVDSIGRNEILTFIKIQD